ncbi:MAG: dTDP-glucose 4,6-dehydratase [Candidatus Aminicenantales bacterium]
MAISKNEIKRKNPAGDQAERVFDGKTILVTGGAGFIGSTFVRMMLARFPSIRIINLDALTYAGNLDNLRDFSCDPRHEFIQGDIRTKDLVTGIFERVQGVFHFAAETHVDRSIVDAGEFVLTDVFGTYILLEALRRSPHIEFFLHISTDEVYGSRDEGFFKETDPLNPSSPYAASKTGADRLAYAYHVTYGVPIIIVRPSNNYGPYQYPEKFIPLFTTNALEGKELPLYGKGLNVRDWLFVEDNCRGIELVARRGAIGEAYNIGANDEWRNIDVARRILKILGKKRDLIKFVPDRLGHDRRYALNCRKLRSLGWKTGVEFDDGLERTVTWYVENEDWWRKIKERSADFKSFYGEYYKDRK